MSAECERAARVRTLPIRRGGTPLLARTEFIARTTARSVGVADAPRALSGFMCVTEPAPARALTASARPSKNTTTLRRRGFPDIRRSAQEVSGRRGRSPWFQLELSTISERYLLLSRE